MKIGVLAVQGAFIEHEHIIEKIGHEVVEIRQKKDLEGIDGIILPGGESTVQGQLLRKLDMLDTIKSAIADGLPCSPPPSAPAAGKSGSAAPRPHGRASRSQARWPHTAARARRAVRAAARVRFSAPSGRR